MKLRVLFVAVMMALSACATAYSSHDFFGGFSSFQIDQNSWRVNFSGNAYTSAEKAIDYNLLRCAEITLENGYAYFVVVGESQRTDYSRVDIKRDSFFFAKPSARNTIICYKERPNEFAYSAEFTGKSIRAKYGMK